MSSRRVSSSLAHLHWLCCIRLGSGVGCRGLGPVNQCLSFYLIRSLQSSLLLLFQIYCLSSLRTKRLSPMRECSTHPRTALGRPTCCFPQLSIFAATILSSLRLMLDWLGQRRHRVVDVGPWSTIIEPFLSDVGLHLLVCRAAGPCQYLYIRIQCHIVPSFTRLLLLCSVVQLHQFA